MSGIAAIYNLDGRVADLTLLRRMMKAVSHRGPDGAAQWARGPVALGHLMLHSTPESLLEQQPLTDESGQLCLSLDGRIDNRGELRGQLESKGLRLRSDTDAELVLRAYECWEEECPERLFGDFAFVIWDGRRRRLFCARDIMGIKPLYYSLNGRTLLIGSELRQILSDPSVPRHPNEAMVAEYLISSISLEETLYRGIFRLPRAHAFTCTDQQQHKRRYWAVDWRREPDHGGEKDYSARFFEVFAEAVRCRLRSCGPVGAELSGGLDSSSVVATAGWLRERAGAGNLGLESFSVVFPGLPCDESRYIDQVSGRWNVPSNRLPEKAPDGVDYANQIRMHGDFPDSPTVTMNNCYLELAQSRGIRVMLGGDGGDQLLGGSPHHCADLVRGLKFGQAYAQSRSDAQVFSGLGNPRSAAFVFLRYGLWPQLPAGLQSRIGRIVRRGEDEIPDWIAPDFVRQTGLRERLEAQQRSAAGCPTRSLRETVAAGLEFPWYCMHDRHASGFGLEYRSPFLDRRVIEFAAALPEQQRRWDGQTKFVLRQAMKGLLPESVRLRLTKARFDHCVPRALQSLGGLRLFQSMWTESAGWVDGKRLRRMYRQMTAFYEQNDPQYRRFTWQLWMAGGAELWARTVLRDDFSLSEVCTNPVREQSSEKERTWTSAPRRPLSQSLNHS